MGNLFNASKVIKFLPVAFLVFFAACEKTSETACKTDPESPINLKTITLNQVGGGPEKFEQYLGKLVVMNIWATWCLPCLKEMPALQALSDRLPPEKGVVLGISIDRQSENVVAAYLQKNNISFTNYIDPKQSVTSALLKVNTLPETFIFGPSGCLVDRILGIQEWDSDETYERLSKIMSQK